MPPKKTRKHLSAVLLLTFLLTAFCLGVFYFLTLPPSGPASELVSFTIEKGETIDSIGTRLKAANLIRSSAAFKLVIFRYNLAKRIQAGEFQLSPSWKLIDLAKSLTLGRSDIKITVYEGLRREEITDLISSQFTQNDLLFDKQEFLAVTENQEGYLFPDTYFLPKTTTAAEVASLLLTTFEKKVDAGIREKLRRQNLSLPQALTIASLVEREAKLDFDRPIVAGIILKRWQNNWGLEIDAAVQYALGYQKDTGSWWKQSLTKQDLETKSPFNTYLFPGLPPAPICNPSFSSINAVAHQQPTAYWFYLSDSNGNLHYAETLKEHNANIARYLNKP